jgi:acetyl esterase/lipase
VRKTTFVAACALMVGAHLAAGAQPVGADPPVLKVWPDGVPGVMANGGAETVRIEKGDERVVSNVHDPSLSYYLPTSNASGAAVIVIPGGGHRELWTGHEGHNVARFLAERGVAGLVLKYRLARAPGSTYTVEHDALNDLKRAIRIVRARAAEWKVDPNKVGIMGFSAGGQLAALGATLHDLGDPDAKDAVARQSSRPDFAALVYPGTWPDLKIDAQTPPMFLLCGSDDRPQVVTGITQVYAALRAAQVPAELHLYDGVPHGFGLRATNTGPVTRWPTQFVEWMQARKLVAP